MYITISDYLRICELVTLTGEKLTMHNVKKENHRTDQQLYDFRLLFSLLVRAVVFCSFTPLSQVRPCASTLRSALYRESVPSISTCFEFVQCISEELDTKKISLLLSIFAHLFFMYFKQTNSPVCEQPFFDTELWQEILSECFPKQYIKKTLEEVNEFNSKIRPGTYNREHYGNKR